MALHGGDSPTRLRNLSDLSARARLLAQAHDAAARAAGILSLALAKGKITPRMVQESRRYIAAAEAGLTKWERQSRDAG